MAAVRACSRLSGVAIAGALMAGAASQGRRALAGRVEEVAIRRISGMAESMVRQMEEGSEILKRHPRASSLAKVFVENTRDEVFKDTFTKMVNSILGIQPGTSLEKTMSKACVRAGTEATKAAARYQELLDQATRQ